MNTRLELALVWAICNPAVVLGVPILVAAATWLYRNRLREIMP